MIASSVRVDRRTPSAVIVGGAWVDLIVRLRCSHCRMEIDRNVTLWGAASGIAEDTENTAERDARATLDAVASALSERWALTSDGALRCFGCRRPQDCGVFAPTTRAA